MTADCLLLMSNEENAKYYLRGSQHALISGSLLTFSYLSHLQKETASVNLFGLMPIIFEYKSLSTQAKRYLSVVKIVILQKLNASCLIIFILISQNDKLISTIKREINI